MLKQDDVNADTSLVITNAIHFKGTWVTPFQEEDTVELDFWKNSTESVRADFMYISEGEFDYASLDGIKIIRMPYNGDRLSMLVILPNGRDGIGSLEETISAGQIEQWTQSMRKEMKVMLLMPKFTMGTSYNLSTYLKNLGMTDAFNRGLADLSGIAPVTPDRNLYVYKAVHKAYVDVNEGGTEAAAATAVVLATTSGPKTLYRKASVHIHNTGRRERGDPVHGKAVGSHGVAWEPALSCFAHRPHPVFAALVACLLTNSRPQPYLGHQTPV